MLTPNQLERASEQYRRGYTHAVKGQLKTNDNSPGSFGRADYDEGYKAGLNDRRDR